MITQKSQLLTTLAAATLLASAGTALAQSPRVSFSPSSGSVSEGATADADAEHPLLIVTVRAWNLPASPAGEGADGQPTARQQAIDALGEITIETEGIGSREAATISPLYDTDAALDEDTVFAASDRFQLTVTPVQDADSLNDEFTLRLWSTEAISTGSAFRGTVIDDDPLGTASFSHTDIRVFEESTAELSIRLTAAQGRSLPTRFDTRGNVDIVLAVTPGAAVRVEACPTEGDRSNALRVWSETETLARGPGWGEVTIDKDISEYAQTPAELRLTACGDMTEFRDSRFTLAFKESSLHTPAGRIAAGPPAVIQVRNDDPLPTVSLAPPEVVINEGMTQSFAIAAEGRLANAVMRVGVRVTGDALISLLQDGRRLRANAGGIHTFNLGDNAISKLTIRADEDENLADNQTKTATVTIVDASGADIGDDNTLTVTVRGSTAVPALPVVGRLLLGLFMMAGGAGCIGGDRFRPVHRSATCSYGVCAPQFSSFAAVIESIAFADWVRRTPRVSAALRPRRRTPPSRAPDRRRRGAVERPDGQPAPVRRQPGPSSAVPGYREKSVGKTVGKESLGERSAIWCCHPGRSDGLW